MVTNLLWISNLLLTQIQVIKCFLFKMCLSFCLVRKGFPDLQNTRDQVQRKNLIPLAESWWVTVWWWCMEKTSLCGPDVSVVTSTHSRLTYIDAIRYQRLDQGKTNMKGKGQQGNREKWKWEPGRRSEEEAHKTSCWTSGSSAVHSPCCIGITQCSIKHFHRTPFTRQPQTALLPF